MENKAKILLEQYERDGDYSKLKNELLLLYSVGRPLPDDYQEVKDSFLDFLETSLMVDVKMQSIPDIIEKTDKAVDSFAKYLLRQ